MGMVWCDEHTRLSTEASYFFFLSLHILLSSLHVYLYTHTSEYRDVVVQNEIKTTETSHWVSS